jgi:hypothetical protein
MRNHEDFRVSRRLTAHFSGVSKSFVSTLLNGRILYFDRDSGGHIAPADPAWRVTA